MASDLTTRKQLPTEASQQQQEYTEEQYHEDQVAGQPVAMGKTASTQCADFLASTTTTANFVEASALDPSHVYVNSAGIGVVDQISAEDVLLDAAIAYDHKRAAPSATPGEHLLPYNNNNNKRLRTELFSSPVPETIPSPVAAQAKKVHNAQWDGMFERLRVYKLRYGDCLVPKRFADDSKLGTWVETQRVQYKRLTRTQDESSGAEIIHPNKRLTTERLQKLESIGFAWVAKYMKKKASGNNGDSGNAQQQQHRRQRVNEAQWEEFYQRLVQYREQFGDCLVPRKFQTDPKLATWVEGQRILWNKDIRRANAAANTTSGSDGGGVPDPAPPVDDGKIKRLTAERKQKLDTLGFVWSLRSKRIDDHWDEMFRQLLDYKEVHGDCLVPSRFESNLKLGKWVETQRYEYTKLQRAAKGTIKHDEPDAGAPIPDMAEGKARPTNPRLTKGRLCRLESIGFEWRVKNKMKRYYDRQWDQMLQRLLHFKQVNGHCLVPKRYPPDMKLGTWVHTQRIQYRKFSSGKKGGPVSEEEVTKLLSGQTASLTEEEKDTMKSCQGEEVTFRLTDSRRKRLEKAGFVWSAREGEKGAEIARITRNTYDDQWDNMFEKLREFKEKHGHCLVPKRHKENPKLGTWVDTQRVQYKKLQKALAQQDKSIKTVGDDQQSERLLPNSSSKPLVGRLTKDRIKRLQSLNFVWSIRDDWQKHYEELKAYKEEIGHCNVPARYEKNRRLGIWVSAQRQQYKIMRQIPDATKGRRSAPLTEQRIALLNEIGFTWTIRSRETFSESWSQRFEELKEFKRVNGHCLVPSRYSTNPELGVWVGGQRSQYRVYMKTKENGDCSVSGMNEDRIHELEELGFAWGVRGVGGRPTNASPIEEVVAAAEAAAAVEVGDQVAAGVMEHYHHSTDAIDQVSVQGEYVAHQI